MPDPRSSLLEATLRGFFVSVALVAVVSGALATSAQVDGRRYLGPHPLDLEGNWHFVEGVHEHGALPVGLEPFAAAGGILVFLADPVAYGYTQAVFGYVGSHPLPSPAPGYCGIPGVHRHPFVPEGSYQRDAEGNYRYRGAFRGGRAVVTPRRTIPPRPIVAGTPTIPFATPHGYGYGYGYGYGVWYPAIHGGSPPSRPPTPGGGAERPSGPTPRPSR